MALLPFTFDARKHKPFVLCSVENCFNEVYVRGVCAKHNRQIKLNGCILSRTIYDLNEIEILETHALIYIYDKYCNVIDKAMIDLEDVAKIKCYKWSKSNGMGYVFNSKVGRLHHFVIGSKQVVDHKNNNVMDCRKDNLRICTKAENNMNKIKPSNNTSGAKGVTWSKEKQVFLAYINKDKKSYKLGRFKDVISAAEAYNKAAIELFGEFAWLNDIEALKLQNAVTTTKGE